ncbi:MAG: aldo/keto reductase [bacterium]|jgi:predicted oxidoreductase|nr:aldo/keto reductase [bacterium]
MKVPSIPTSSGGPKFSKLIQGFWRLSDWNQSVKDTVAVLEACMERGITTFDHADIYGGYTCETLFGKAFAESGIDREAVQIVTKCGIKLVTPNRPQHHFHGYDTTKAHIVQSVENSLTALQTHYIDVLLIHRPDPLMDAEEVADAFKTLQNCGKVLYFGVSNFLPSQMELLQSRLDLPLVTNQIEYSVLNMENQDNGVIDLCQQRGIKPMAWSPFAGGRLFTEESEQAVHVRNTLQRIGQELGGASIDQVALAFILKHPVDFLPVLGTGQIERIHRATESLRLTLSHDQWFQIWTASQGHEVP